MVFYAIIALAYSILLISVGWKSQSRNTEHPVGIIVISPFWPVTLGVALMSGGWIREMWSGRWKIKTN